MTRRRADNCFPPWPGAKLDLTSNTTLSADEMEWVVTEHAEGVLRRCCLDPTDPAWRPLVHEIAKAICEGQLAMLKNMQVLVDDKFGEVVR